MSDTNGADLRPFSGSSLFQSLRFLCGLCASAVKRSADHPLSQCHSHQLPRVKGLKVKGLKVPYEGNFARYRIRPSEFESWKAVWSAAGNHSAGTTNSSSDS